jgi:hypothetical protein
VGGSHPNRFERFTASTALSGSTFFKPPALPELADFAIYCFYLLYRLWLLFTRLCRAPDYVVQSANNCQKVNIFQRLALSTEGHIHSIILGTFAIQSVANRLHLHPLRYGKTSLEGF